VPIFGSSQVEFSNGLANSAFFLELFSVSHAHQKRGGAEAIDLPGNTFGVIIDASEGIIRKESAAFVTVENDLVADISHRLGQVKRREMIGGGQAVEKGVVRGQAQGAAQFGLTNQQQGSQGLAVHMGGEEQADLLKGRMRK